MLLASIGRKESNLSNNGLVVEIVGHITFKYKCDCIIIPLILKDLHVQGAQGCAKNNKTNCTNNYNGSSHQKSLSAMICMRWFR